MPAVHMHTEALAGRDETCRWMSAAAGASGDRVLTSRLYSEGVIFNRKRGNFPRYTSRDIRFVFGRGCN